MPIMHLMSEICNLAYLIVENIVEEEYGRHRSGAAGSSRRKGPRRPHRLPDTSGHSKSRKMKMME